MFSSINRRLTVSLLAVFIVLLAPFTPAIADDEIVSIAGKTMGTTYHIKWIKSDDIDHPAKDVQDKIDQRLAEINQAMSTYIADSELSLFNQLPTGAQKKISSELYGILKKAQNISLHSNGAYDVTVGPLINLWGFGPDKKVVKAPSDEEIEKIRSKVGYQYLQLLDDNVIKKNADIYIDLSSIAKGYAVDEVAHLISEQGFSNYLVEIGGEIVTKGSKPNNDAWKIAIESPTAIRGIQRIVSVNDVAVATSGDYRIYFEENGVRYSHIIDTATGKPITHNLASVSVMADESATADALATAFLAMGVEKSYQYALEHNIDAFFILKKDKGFEEKVTPGFAKRILE